MFFGEYTLYNVNTDASINGIDGEPLIFESLEEAKQYKETFGYKDYITVPVNHFFEKSLN